MVAIIFSPTVDRDHESLEDTGSGREGEKDNRNKEYN